MMGFVAWGYGPVPGGVAPAGWVPGGAAPAGWVPGRSGARGLGPRRSGARGLGARRSGGLGPRGPGFPGGVTRGLGLRRLGARVAGPGGWVRLAAARRRGGKEPDEG